jgi:hypothetical protein
MYQLWWVVGRSKTDTVLPPNLVATTLANIAMEDAIERS